jgi:type I restriction enzyme S subunit
MPKDDKWKEKYKEPEKAVVENLPVLPDEWDWVSLDLVSEPNRALTYGVIKLGDHLENGVPVLRSSNVRHMNIELKGLKKIDPKLSDKYSRTILQGGEVVITVRGTLGGVAAVPDEYRGWNVSREVVVIPAQKEFDSHCLAIFIGSLPIQNWFNRNTKGIAYTGINIETLKEAPVPLVSLDEQNEIVRIVEEKLSSIEHLDTELDRQLIKAERSKQSILATAFSGRLQ